jgi:hypothetical protein
MSDEVIDWAVAAFKSNAGASGADVMQLLTANGFALDEAVRALSTLTIGKIAPLESAKPTGGRPTPGEQLTSAMKNLLKRHRSKLQCEVKVFANELTATWALFQADFEFASPLLGPRRIVESFACSGSTIAEAMQQALDNVSQASLHVVLYALEGFTDGSELAQWEECGPFRLCSGLVIRRFSPPVVVNFASFLETLKELLLEQALSNQIHWFRTYAAIKGKPTGGDALLDNQPLAAAEKLMLEWPWPANGGELYSLRHFLILVPKSLGIEERGGWFRRLWPRR